VEALGMRYDTIFKVTLGLGCSPPACGYLGTATSKKGIASRSFDARPARPQW